MRKFFSSVGVTAAIALFAFAMPGSANTVFGFTSGGACTPGSGTCGTATASGTGSSKLSEFDVLNFNSFTLSVTGFAQETWTLNGVTDDLKSTNGTDFTLSGTATCTSGCRTGQNVYTGSMFTFTDTTNTTTNNGGGVFGISISNTTSLSETQTFLTDLGLTTLGSLGTGYTSGAVTTSSFTNTGSATGPAAMNLGGSSTLQITTNQSFATPEPVSFLLFGTGLAAIALFAKRKARTAAPVTVQ
jgi:hypothetical protein